MRRDRPPPQVGARPGLLNNLDTCTVSQTSKKTKAFPSKIQRALAEFRKCAARFDAGDAESVTLSVIGVALVAQDILGICRDYQRSLGPDVLEFCPDHERRVA
jgi:hypothetical protein